MRYPQLADKAWLESKLTENTQRDIALELGCGVDTVNKWVKKHNLSPEKKSGFTREQLISLLKKYSLAEIGEMYGITKQAVRLRAQKLEVDTSRDLRHPLRNKELFEELHVNQELNFTQIAKQYNTDVNFVSTVARSLGIECRTRSEKKDVDLGHICKLYESGYSPAVISKMTGHHSSLIRRKLRKAGVKMRGYYDSVNNKTVITERFLLCAVDERKTVKELAADTGLSVRSIREAYYRSEIEPYSRNVGFPRDVTRDQLYDLYWIQKKSAIVIAEDFGCSVNAVYAAMIRLDIRVRSLSEASKRSSKYLELNDPIWLKQCYEDEKLSMNEIAGIVGCSVGMIAHYLNRYNIKVRTKFETLMMLNRKVSEKFDGMMINFFGYHTSYNSRKGGEVRGTQVELKEANKLDNDDDVLTFMKEYPIKYKDARGRDRTYVADYFVKKKNEEEIVEVKVPGELDALPEVRRRIVRQVRIGLAYSERTGVKYRISTGHDPKQFLSSLTDMDLYYSYSYYDIFDTAQSLVDFLIKMGFCGARLSRTALQEAIRSMKKVKPSLNSNHPCRPILWLMRHFHPHYFDSYHKDYMSIRESFGKRDLLGALVGKAYASQTRKTFDIYQLIDDLIKLGRDVKPPSLFKPWVASYIYDKYIPNGGIVVDPCCGWGARALGTLERPIRYIGFDLNTKSVIGNQELFKFAKTSLGDCSFEPRDCTGSWGVSGVDLVFTSPPYFDTEIYDGIPDYKPDKSLLRKLVETASESLKTGGILALNLPERMEGECRLVAKEYGLEIIDYLQMATASLLRESTTEPILIFKKVDKNQIS